MCNVQTGGESMEGNMSEVEKRREGICPGGKNDWREYVRGVKNDEREYVREGICLYPVALYFGHKIKT